MYNFSQDQLWGFMFFLCLEKTDRAQFLEKIPPLQSGSVLPQYESKKILVEFCKAMGSEK